MKKYLIIYSILLSFGVLICGCEKDNIEAPKSKLTGRLVYNGQPLGLRSNGVAFELWQKGFQLFSRIPLNINQDGSFSSVLFDGDYKLVRSLGSGPWVDVADSIDVKLNGSANLDIPVEPYSIVKDVAFIKEGADLKATFTVQTINTTKSLELVRIYIGPNLILDQNNNSANKQALKAAIDITKPIVLTVTIPANLVSESYVYARVGVKTTGIAELLYSPSVKVTIN